MCHDSLLHAMCNKEIIAVLISVFTHFVSILSTRSQSEEKQFVTQTKLNALFANDCDTPTGQKGIQQSATEVEVSAML